MAKLRQNHQRNSRGGSSSFLIRLIAVTVVGILLLVGIFWNYSSDKSTFSPKSSSVVSDAEDRFYLGEQIDNHPIIHHKYYSLSYNEEFEQADWVAYYLTKEDLLVKNVKRTNWFMEDSLVPSKSAGYYDYKRSGYTKGHLAPAGDMAFSKEAMRESFFMSNMSPQIRGFNNGIWKELEEQTRDWAFDSGGLYITVGPAIPRGMKQRIGKSEVGVPKYFYKAIVRPGKNPEGIAFLMPHQISKDPIHDYVLSIDELEDILGFDVFPELLSEDLESEVESSYDIDQWPYDRSRFKQRVEHWNKQ